MPPTQPKCQFKEDDASGSSLLPGFKDPLKDILPPGEYALSDSEWKRTLQDVSTLSMHSAGDACFLEDRGREVCTANYLSGQRLSVHPHPCHSIIQPPPGRGHDFSRKPGCLVMNGASVWTSSRAPRAEKPEHQALQGIERKELDKAIAKKAENPAAAACGDAGEDHDRRRRLVVGEDGIGPPPKQPRVRLASAAISSFTPEVFFQRMAGDFQQVENLRDLDVDEPALEGSLHFGRVLNVDEVYATFVSFGLINDDSRRTFGCEPV